MAQGGGRRQVARNQAQAAPRPPARRRVAPHNLPESPGSGEEFDFTGVDGRSSDDDGIQQDEHALRPVSPASVEPVAGSAASTRPVTPSAQASERPASRTAFDIDFFFKQGSKADLISSSECNACKYVVFHLVQVYNALITNLLLQRQGSLRSQDRYLLAVYLKQYIMQTPPKPTQGSLSS